MITPSPPRRIARFGVFGALCAAVLLPGFAGRAVGETLTPVVTTTADVSADDGVRSLREALTYANSNPGTTVSFNIPLAQAVGGVFTIRPNSSLPIITAAGTVINGATQTTATGNTNSSGPEIALSGVNTSSGSPGLYINNVANCAVSGIAIHSFAGAGLRILGSGASNTQVRACYIGTNAAGSAASANGTDGIAIYSGAKGTTIGDGTVAGRNVIAGNNSSNIIITGAGTDNTVVQGNYIGLNAAGTARLGSGLGIMISQGARNNRIGGTSAGAGNVVVGNGVNIQVQSLGTANNIIQGNLVGTNAAGTAPLHAADHSILITGRAEQTTVGGTAPGARNVISDGVSGALGITFSNYNVVQGNYIGINAAGTAALGNTGAGLILYASSHNTVGGTAAGAGNAIVGGTRPGVWILNELGVANADFNTVQGNTIGTNAAGTAKVGNQIMGIELGGACNNNVIGLDLNGAGKGNVIAFGASSSERRYGGVLLSEGEQNDPQGNTIRGNSIFGNAGLGIDIRFVSDPYASVTPNDNDDADAGPNGIQNFPVIDSAIAGSSTTVNCSLNSTPNSNFIIDFYTNPAADASGYGEGQTYLGSTDVDTDAAGDVVFSFAADDLTGQYVTATATNSTNGSTSEFSAVRLVISGMVSISGRVATSSGTGISGVSVRAGTIAPAVTTNSNGDYTISGLGNGTYNMTASKAGYAFTTSGFTNPVVATTNRTGINFIGTTSVAIYTVSGRVATSGGVGISGVTISASGSGETAVTASNGDYILDGLPASSYAIAASRSGYNFANSGFSNPVTVGPNRTGVNFVGTVAAAGLYTVSGRISSSGNGIGGVSVTLNGSRQVVTNTNGDYNFTGVAPGYYTVMPVTTPAMSGTVFAPDSRAITVASSNVGNVNFTTSYSISGRVVNHSGGGFASVQVIATSAAGSFGTFTDPAGNFALGGLPSNSYSVAPVLTPALAGVTFTPASSSVVIDRTNRTNINFTGMFSLSGRVANHSGAGIPNVQVRRTAGTSVVTAVTDSSGNYRFTSVRSGSYTLAPVLTPALSGMSFSPTSLNVTLSTASVANQNFIGMFSITGRIVTSGGVARAGVLVRLNVGSSSTSTLTDSSGNYKFTNVRSGSYTIVPSGTGFAPTSRSVTVGTLSLTNQNFTG